MRKSVGDRDTLFEWGDRHHGPTPHRQEWGGPTGRERTGDGSRRAAQSVALRLWTRRDPCQHHHGAADRVKPRRDQMELEVVEVALPPQEALQQVSGGSVAQRFEARFLPDVGLGGMGRQVVGEFRRPSRQLERGVARETEGDPLDDALLPKGGRADAVGVQHRFETDSAPLPLPSVFGDEAQVVAVQLVTGRERVGQDAGISGCQLPDVLDAVRGEASVGRHLRQDPVDHRGGDLVEALDQTPPGLRDLGIKGRPGDLSFDPRGLLECVRVHADFVQILQANTRKLWQVQPLTVLFSAATVSAERRRRVYAAFGIRQEENACCKAIRRCDSSQRKHTQALRLHRLCAVACGVERDGSRHRFVRFSQSCRAAALGGTTVAGPGGGNPRRPPDDVRRGRADKCSGGSDARQAGRRTGRPGGASAS